MSRQKATASIVDPVAEYDELFYVEGYLLRDCVTGTNGYYLASAPYGCQINREEMEFLADAGGELDGLQLVSGGVISKLITNWEEPEL